MAAENEAFRRAHPTQQLPAVVPRLDRTVGAVTTATAARGDRARSFIFIPGSRQASTLQERRGPLDRTASRSQPILCQRQRSQYFRRTLEWIDEDNTDRPQSKALDDGSLDGGTL